jgi:hypothetical protein
VTRNSATSSRARRSTSTSPPGRRFSTPIDDAVDSFVDSDGDGLDDNDTTLDQLVDVDGDGLDDRFEDPIVDVNNDNEDDRYVDVPAPYKYVYATKVSVDMEVTGDLVEGVVKTVTSRACQGTGCPNDFANTCTTKASFDGVHIHDADVTVMPGQGSGAPSMGDPGSSQSNNSSSDS